MATISPIVNLPVFKNTGNAISMATKNIGYGAVCNTNRLHAPLFLDDCVEVPAFWPVRDKMVLNITDGLRSRYEGGPDKNAKFTYVDNLGDRPASKAEAAALAHLKANLDPYLKVTGDRPDGFDFVDFQAKKGTVARSGAVLDLRFNGTDSGFAVFDPGDGIRLHRTSH